MKRILKSGLIKFSILFLLTALISCGNNNETNTESGNTQIKSESNSSSSSSNEDSDSNSSSLSSNEDSDSSDSSDTTETENSKPLYLTLPGSWYKTYNDSAVIWDFDTGGKVGIDIIPLDSEYPTPITTIYSYSLDGNYLIMTMDDTDSETNLPERIEGEIEVKDNILDLSNTDQNETDYLKRGGTYSQTYGKIKAEHPEIVDFNW